MTLRDCEAWISSILFRESIRAKYQSGTHEGIVADVWNACRVCVVSILPSASDPCCKSSLARWRRLRKVLMSGSALFSAGDEVLDLLARYRHRTEKHDPEAG
jgi:hypothetical protein